MSTGPLIIVSGPSGSGKSTLIREVLREKRFPLRLSVSATTRDRLGDKEQDGVDYYFWNEERFKQELESGGLLEHAIVHGHSYGTPRTEVAGHLEKGQGVILDIDVQGAAQVRNLFPKCVSIFIVLSRPEMYEERIRKRGSESEATIARRLESARRELERRGEYQHEICNDDLAPALQRFYELIAPHFSPAL